MTLTTSQLVHTGLVRTGTHPDPHAHHRREALARHRSRRKAVRRARLSMLQTTLRSATAPLESLIRLRDVAPFASGSGGRADL